MNDELAPPVDEDGRARLRPETRRGKRRADASAAAPQDGESEKLARLELLLLERPGPQPDDG